MPHPVVGAASVTLTALEAFASPIVLSQQYGDTLMLRPVVAAAPQLKFSGLAAPSQIC